MKQGPLYDILYENGVSLRFVPERDIRLLPEKRVYAYRVELCVVLMIVLLPISLCGMVIPEYAGLSGIFLIIPSIVLILIFTVKLGIVIYKHFKAGLIKLVGFYAVYSLSLWLLLITGLQLSSGASYSSVASLFFVALLASLPPLYTMKPTFAVAGLILFVQLGPGLMMVAAHLDGTPNTSQMAVAAFPILTSIITVMVFRWMLAKVWDVSLKIRPLKNLLAAQASGDDETLAYKIYRTAQECWERETVFAACWDKVSDICCAFG